MDIRPQTDTQETIMSNWTSEEKILRIIECIFSIDVVGCAKFVESFLPSNVLKQQQFPTDQSTIQVLSEPVCLCLVRNQLI